MSRVLINLIGDKFGLLTVVSEAESRLHTGYPQRHRYWNCVCECGGTICVWHGNLRYGRTKSCGCTGPEKRKTHGMSSSDTYKRFIRIRKLNRDEFCEQWLGESGFTCFLSEMGEAPDKKTLLRKNRDEPFSAVNCCWGDVSMALAGSHGTIVEINGVKRAITAWSDSLGVSRQAMSLRIKSGWGLEEAATTPKTIRGGGKASRKAQQ